VLFHYDTEFEVAEARNIYRRKGNALGCPFCVPGEFNTFSPSGAIGALALGRGGF
jgi:hypothetical protein